VRRETLVWTEEMPQWARAGEVKELQYLFTGAPAPKVTVTQEQTIVPPMPKTWLTESVLGTVIPLICCWNIFSLFGIIGIVYATQVESLYRRGDYDAAEAASRNAGKWAKVGLWIIFGWIVLLVIAFFVILTIVGSVAAMGDWILT